MRKTKRLEFGTNIIQGIFIIIAAFLAIAFVICVNDLQGNAKVVNYAGYVRGSTQRLIKLELFKQPNDALIEKLDSLINSLKNGGGEYNLRKINAPGFVESLEKQEILWASLKQEIQQARKPGSDNNRLLTMSEDYFTLANQTVREVETFSDAKAAGLQAIETAFIAVMSVIVVLLVYKTAAGIILAKKNDALNDLAFYDASTGLPNKGKCDSLLQQHGALSTSQNDACVMFDLNNLKTVNDTLGHKTGDRLIFSFASLIRSTMPKDVFVGRYGGDEFIAVLFDTDEATVMKLLGDIEQNVRRFNQSNIDFSINYAVGYQMSCGSKDCSLQMLLHKADQKMYADKEKKKRLHSAMNANA